jgi:mono/diheme cytochrome c family protein
MDARQRRSHPLISILALALLGLAPIRVLAQAATTAPAGNTQNGKRSFTTRTCATCHGNDAQGTVGGGPRIGPPDRSFADFLQYVRMPTGNMPAVSSQRVPDSEIADIYAYLRTMAPATAAISAASGNAANGKKIFASYGCYECHGFEGQGSRQTGTPPIGPPAMSMPAFAHYVRHPTGEMPPYAGKVVSDQDLADIYAFLQSIALPPPIKNIPLLNQ